MSDAAVDIPPTLVLEGRVALAVTGQLGVAVFNVERWTPSLASRYVADAMRVSGGAPIGGTLNCYLGPLPGAAERRAFASAVVESGLGASQAVALISDSTITRGAAIAYGWLTGAPAKGFTSDEVATAARWLASLGIDGSCERAVEYYEGAVELLRPSAPRVPM